MDKKWYVLEYNSSRAIGKVVFISDSVADSYDEMSKLFRTKNYGTHHCVVASYDTAIVGELFSGVAV